MVTVSRLAVEIVGWLVLEKSAFLMPAATATFPESG